MLPFDVFCGKVERRIEEGYGIRVVTRDIPDPLTGDLNGVEIHLDCAVTAEQRLFLLAHLFGHTVQWNTDPMAYDLGRPQTPPVSGDALPGLMEYEREAAGYALSLLHESGVRDVDQWFADYAACDAAYLRHFYVTGEKREFLSFWRDGTALLQEAGIPRFKTVERCFRTDGIVI